MILGKIVDGRVVSSVIFCLTEATDLTLPPQAVAAMKLPMESAVIARLADGSQYKIPVHLAKIRWYGQELFVTVLATGTKPLLGTALLQGFRLTVEFADDGIVKIEKM
jgi:clan AA aspartic protease